MRLLLFISTAQAQAQDTRRYELDTFVCDGEYENALRRCGQKRRRHPAHQTQYPLEKRPRQRRPLRPPWFEKFGGDRINDYHLSIEAKQAARARAEANGEAIA